MCRLSDYISKLGRLLFSLKWRAVLTVVLLCLHSHLCTVVSVMLSLSHHVCLVLCSCNDSRKDVFSVKNGVLCYKDRNKLEQHFILYLHNCVTADDTFQLV
jgi:hypothetical protein